MAQVIKCLPSKCEALCSNPSPTKKKKKSFVKYYVLCAIECAAFTPASTQAGEQCCTVMRVAGTSLGDGNFSAPLYVLCH
jgi:hypothetical protein